MEQARTSVIARTHDVYIRWYASSRKQKQCSIFGYEKVFKNTLGAIATLDKIKGCKRVNADTLLGYINLRASIVTITRAVLRLRSGFLYMFRSIKGMELLLTLTARSIIPGPVELSLGFDPNYAVYFLVDDG